MNARRNRILVLDIDEQVLLELQRQLESEGFEITTTWDMAEALKLVASRHFDLLLVGDNAPEVSGSEVLRELQCGRVGIPCVILQTGPGPFEPDYFYSLGASGVIQNWKSVDVGQWVSKRYPAVRAAAAG